MKTTKMILIIGGIVGATLLLKNRAAASTITPKGTVLPTPSTTVSGTQVADTPYIPASYTGQTAMATLMEGPMLSGRIQSWIINEDVQRYLASGWIIVSGVAPAPVPVSSGPVYKIGDFVKTRFNWAGMIVDINNGKYLIDGLFMSGGQRAWLGVGDIYF